MLSLVFAAAVTSTAPADFPPTVSAANVTAKQTPAPEKVVCRTEAVTGSLFGHRVCLTAEDWARRRRGAQDLAKDIQDRPRVSVTKDAP